MRHVMRIDADSTVTEHDLDDRDLPAMQSLLDDGWLEGIGVPERGWVGFVDEEGRLKGLPLNVAASRVAVSRGWLGGTLVGPVVFCGTADAHGDFTDVPDDLVDAAHRIGDRGPS